jgi:Ran GTPase-activating protein (RanGAP) involved in mRNA processing and transport
MAPNPRIADLANRGLKLETAASVEDLFRDLDLKCIETIVLTGNTFSVAAGEALGKVIRRMPNLKVSYLASTFLALVSDLLISR